MRSFPSEGFCSYKHSLAFSKKYKVIQSKRVSILSPNAG